MCIDFIKKKKGFVNHLNSTQASQRKIQQKESRAHIYQKQLVVASSSSSTRPKSGSRAYKKKTSSRHRKHRQTEVRVTVLYSMSPSHPFSEARARAHTSNFNRAFASAALSWLICADPDRHLGAELAIPMYILLLKLERWWVEGTSVGAFFFLPLSGEFEIFFLFDRVYVCMYAEWARVLKNMVGCIVWVDDGKCCVYI